MDGMGAHVERVGGKEAMKVQICCNCQNGLEVISKSPDFPHGVVKCRMFGFRKLDDRCGKWKVRIAHQG
jgi:Trm5-related predicted tRNA methylase